MTAMLDTTDRTPAQMADDLIQTMYFPAEAADFARSLQAEAAGKGKTDLAAYWAQVADIIQTASER